MRPEVHAAIEKIKSFGRRLFPERPATPEVLPPPLSAASPAARLEPQTAPEQSGSQTSGFTPPSVDYRAIALGYFSDVLRRSKSEGKEKAEVVAELTQDSILIGVDGSQIEGALRKGIHSPVSARALARLVPENLRRDARRRLTLWEEKTAREQERNSLPQEEKGKREEVKDQDQKSEISGSDQVEAPRAERARNFNMGRLVPKLRGSVKDIYYVVEEIGEDEVAALIKARANKLAKGDERLVRDFTAMMDLIRENPTPKDNPAVKRLATDTRMVINDFVYPLWRFSPRRCSELALTFPKAATFRAVFAVYKSEDKNLVILDGDGLYTHQQYIRKYSLRGE